MYGVLARSYIRSRNRKYLMAGSRELGTVARGPGEDLKLQRQRRESRVSGEEIEIHKV
jgi:hypothetical protein